jgi:L-ascorbate metabolism protein UlaG (beta-lactamase superfamily)
MAKSALVISLCAIAALVTLAAQNAPIAEKNNPVTLKYLGAAGWEITDGSTYILVDPYLSRINGPAPPGGRSMAGDTRRAYRWNDLASPDVATIDAHIQRADFVLVTHTHYDHVMDVPHIALKTRAIVIGTESTGEDYQFASFSIRVIPSIHSALDHKRYFSSAVAPPGMKAPLTLEQIHPEGGTLAYLIRFRGHQILAFGGMNYIEREIVGLEPDVALIGAGASRKEVYDYSGRLMRDLNFPALVLPTHWDNFLAPYSASQEANLDALQSFSQEITAASPKTKVIVPKYFEPIPLEAGK